MKYLTITLVALFSTIIMMKYLPMYDYIPSVIFGVYVAQKVITVDVIFKILHFFKK